MTLEKENSQAERLPPRTCLSNRIDRNNMIYGSNRAMVNNNNILNNGINENDVTPYASFVNLPPGQTRGYSTSQSFSVYENVGVGEEFESTKYALNGQPSTYTYETEGQVHLVEIDNSFETHLNKNVTDDKESSYSEYGLINDRSVTTQSMLPNQRKMIS
ncbi:epidermal growth factor [Schistosoma japonicum]|nr:epidermal growth factor [Schistosoma japonicum]